jgi:uncharacterized protein YukE
MSRNSSRTQGADALQSVGESAKSAAQDVATEVVNVASAFGGAAGSTMSSAQERAAAAVAELSEKSKKAKRKADKALRAAEKSDRKASRQMRKAQAKAADVFAGVVEDVAAAMTGASEPEKTKKKGRAKKVVAVAVVGGVVFVAVRTMRGHRQPNPVTAPVRPIPRPVEQAEDNGRAGAGTAEEA